MIAQVWPPLSSARVGPGGDVRVPLAWALDSQAPAIVGVSLTDRVHQVVVDIQSYPGARTLLQKY